MGQTIIFGFGASGMPRPREIIEEARRMAEELEDWALREWLEVWEKGTPKLRTKKGVIEGIKPKSEFALRNLWKAVRLRREGRVMR